MLEITVAISLVLMVAVLGALVYHLLVKQGRLLLRLKALEQKLGDDNLTSGVAPHTVVHDFSLPLLSGETARLSQWRGKRLLLAFVHPQCSFSEELLQRISGEASLPAQPVFVSSGKLEDNKAFFAKYALSSPVFLQEDMEVSKLFKIPGTPSGYVLNEQGATVGELLVGVDALAGRTGTTSTGLTHSVSKSKLIRDGLPAGTLAPDFKLPTLQGSDLSLNDYRGKRVLLVFSDPDCAPCNRVAPELERIHQRRSGPRVIMISRGKREANEAKAEELKLSFPIALQRQWEISRAYGMFATPVGYLIDENGVLASNVAVGADSILQLAAE